MRHKEGVVVEALELEENCPCPVCQQPLTLKRTTTRNGKTIEDGDGVLETYYRYFTCTKGHFSGKSIEWRPAPFKTCCSHSLSNVRASLSRIIKLDGVLIWERQRSALCHCGESFLWSERMVLGYDTEWS